MRQKKRGSPLFDFENGVCCGTTIGRKRKRREIDTFIVEERWQHELKVLLARKLPRCIVKCKGILPLKYVSCKSIDQLDSRCLNTDEKDKVRDNSFWKEIVWSIEPIMEQSSFC